MAVERPSASSSKAAARGRRKVRKDGTRRFFVVVKSLSGETRISIVYEIR